MISGLRSPLVRFVGGGGALFFLWYFLYELYLRDNTLLDEWVIRSLVRISSFILEALGYSLHTYPVSDWPSQLAIEGAPGVRIGAACDGLVLFVLFIVFVIAFPGKWKDRLWFIPSGVLLIHGINAFRIAALTIIVSWRQEWLSFNHDYTFTIIVYAVVLGLWWVWVKRYSGSEGTQNMNG